MFGFAFEVDAWPGIPHGFLIVSPLFIAGHDAMQETLSFSPLKKLFVLEKVPFDDPRLQHAQRPMSQFLDHFQKHIGDVKRLVESRLLRLYVAFYRNLHPETPQFCNINLFTSPGRSFSSTSYFSFLNL